MKIDQMTISDPDRCIIQITPGQQCHRAAEKPLIYQGKQIVVCNLCYEIIMDKLAKRLKQSDGGTRRKRR